MLCLCNQGQRFRAEGRGEGIDGLPPPFSEKQKSKKKKIKKKKIDVNIMAEIKAYTLDR